jgi:hypothetical protein
MEEQKIVLLNDTEEERTGNENRRSSDEGG